MCGVVAIVANHAVAAEIYEGLTVLQHRGQDAAGIATSDGRRLNLHKRNGLVRDVFNDDAVANLEGNAGIGHCRYPTAGCDSSEEAQPMYVNSPFGIALAHNGNLINADQVKSDLFDADRRHLNTRSDSEVLLNVLAHELQVQPGPTLEAEHVFTAVAALHDRLEGGYAAVALVPEYGVVAFRDPFGIRPLVYGRRRGDDGRWEYMIASESVAMDVAGFELVGDVEPGHAIYITLDRQVFMRQCSPKAIYRPCIFELVYLARPDSMLDDISVYKARLRMGEKLAQKILEEWPDHDIDVVIPVPDTSRTAAIPLAYRLGVKYREGFIKNRYIGRTFIMPGQGERVKSVRRKLNVVDLEFRNKNVLIIDDSIVRGTTSRQIIQMARDAGAARVYFASAAPPVRYPNVYGIDMPAVKELVAHNRTVEEIRIELGADRLIYQDLDDLIDACREGNPDIDQFDTSCFSGEYVTGLPHDYLAQLEQLRGSKECAPAAPA